MKKYFVKTLFPFEWVEVSKENYEKYRQGVINGAWTREKQFMKQLEKTIKVIDVEEE